MNKSLLVFRTIAVFIVMMALVPGYTGGAPALAAESGVGPVSGNSHRDAPETRLAAAMSTPSAADEAFDGFDDFKEFDTPEDPGQKKVFDPLSGYNRVVTVFNDKLYFWVLKPVAQGYRWVAPRPVRSAVDDFFVNLRFPVRWVNNLLQLKLRQTGQETVRFLVNSTVGVAGFWDPAGAWLDIPVYKEDFGQTLGYYGLGGGFHLVLPVLGPSNLRDVCGRTVDWAFSPPTYIEEETLSIGLSVLKTTNKTSLSLGQYEALTKDAIDLYILLRDAYEQNRNKKIEE